MPQEASSNRQLAPNRSTTLTVLANPSAGRRGALEQTILRAFAAEGVETRVLLLEPRELLESVQQAARDLVPVLGVYGGDGTHSLAAGALAGSSTVLAPLPGGTVNTFARRLGMPDLEAAATAVSEGSSHRIPLGTVDGRTFVSTAIFGEYARVIRRREHLRRWLPKWPAAAMAFLLTVARLHHLEIHLDSDAVSLRRRTALLWIGIGSGSFPLPQRAPPLPADPRLEVAVLRPGTRLSMATLLLRFPLLMVAGEAARTGGAFEIFPTRRLRLESRHRIGVTLDGEVSRTTSPLEATVAEGALWVVGAEKRGACAAEEDTRAQVT